jgi:hypothetical protein
MRVKGKEDDKQAQNLRKKEPIEMTSDELLDYALDPELADEVKRVAKPPETTDSEDDC